MAKNSYNNKSMGIYSFTYNVRYQCQKEKTSKRIASFNLISLHVISGLAHANGVATYGYFGRVF